LRQRLNRTQEVVDSIPIAQHDDDTSNGAPVTAVAISSGR